MTLRRVSFIGLGAVAVLLLALAGLWLVRARLAVQFAQGYFRDHGVTATVEVGTLGLSGASGRFKLGPADAPEVAADGIELFFDPLRWKPYLVEVRLKNPLVRARIDDNGKITLPALQAWLDSLSQSKEKSPYVSDDLAVSFTGLRALLATPGGALEVDGDAKLVKMLPVSAALTVKPGTARVRDITVLVQSGVLTLLSEKNGYHLMAKFAGDVSRGSLRADGAGLALDASGVRLAGGRITAAKLLLGIGGKLLSGNGLSAHDANLNIDGVGAAFANGVASLQSGSIGVAAAAVQDVTLGLAVDAKVQGVTASAMGIEGDGDVALSAHPQMPQAMQRTVRALPLLAMEPALQKAVSDNLGPFDIYARAHVARHGGVTSLKLTQPLNIYAAKKGALRVSSLTMTQKDGAIGGNLQAALSGGGLPSLALTASSFTYGEQGLRAVVSVKSKLDFAILKGIDAVLDGTLTAGKGGISFALSRCEPLALAALGPLATKVGGQVCPTAAPLFVLDDAGWRMVAETKSVAAFLPLANAQMNDGAAHLAFDGKTGPHGSIAVTAAKIADAASPLRFKPVAVSGTLDLADGVWHGHFAVTDEKQRPLGTATLTHTMASGVGGAHVEAPLVFAQSGLQPEDLSPLLAMLKKTDGHADFKGDFAWNASGMGANTGTLKTTGFDFLTPMGRAHALDTTLALTSLLPPATADGQGLKIARVDWTLPFSDLGLRFGFNTREIKIEHLETNIAEGHVALTPFTVTLASPQANGRATITSLSLAPLIAASNLSGKASIEGKLSGTIPFTAGPGGFRITDGHLAADGPGRLSLNRSLWGDAALTANMAQDFAYQALENLAFDELSADIDSIAGGRLKIVFHIKGHNAPPKPQSGTVELPVADLLNGSALQRPIPLPSGVPIDLTLDTSLNFDELLQSYAEAWSKALNSGANPQ